MKKGEEADAAALRVTRGAASPHRVSTGTRVRAGIKQTSTGWEIEGCGLGISKRPSGAVRNEVMGSGSNCGRLSSLNDQT